MEYPLYKIIAWRFARVFASAFIIQVAIVLPSLEVYDRSTVYKLLLLPSLIAGLNALGKALREFKGTKDYESLINKLPF